MIQLVKYVRGNRNIERTYRAQSEVIGVILLTAVIVILSVLVGIVILGTIDTTDDPTADLQVDVNGTAVTISHLGGSSFALGDLSIVLRDGSVQRLSLESFTGGNGDGSFNPGEQFSHVHGLTDSVRVLVVHDPSNTFLYDKAFDLPESGGPLVWTSAGDWDSAVSERGVVHADFGDHRANRLEIGYGTDDPSLVGYWTLDGDGATAVDASESNNDGRIEDSPSQGSAGMWNTTAWEFDGDNDGITVPNDTSLEMNRTNEVTVSMWVRKSSPQSGWIGLLQHSDTSYNLQFNGGDEPAFTVYDDGWHTSYGPDLGTGQWHHVVGTFNGSEVRMYVDGTLEGTTTADFIASGNGLPVGIAYNNDSTTGGRHFAGSLDGIRLYDRALTAGEVNDLWAVRSGGSLTTGVKEFERNVDPSNLSLTNVEAVIPAGTTVNVTVESDPDGNGTFTQSDEISLDGSGSYNVTGLSTPSHRYRLVVELATDSPTTGPRFGGASLERD